MILEVQNGCFGYPKQPVILENINLRLEEGHILATLGPNGIGKTTLLKCMIGLLPWHSGKTLFYGKDIRTLKPKDVWSTISYIPQSRGFAFSYTGLEMVLLGRSAHLGTFQQPGKEEIEMAEAMPFWRTTRVTGCVPSSSMRRHWATPTSRQSGRPALSARS